MEMKEVNIGSIGGIHYEMYDPDPQNLHTDQICDHLDGKPVFFNLNGVFWSKIFSDENIEKLVESFLIHCNEFNEPEPYERIIQTAPELFKSAVQEAKNQLCEQGLSEKEYFGYLETLAITCKMYSRLYYAPFELTVHEGFLLESYSSMEMLNNCLIPAKNPYLQFLEQYVWGKLLHIEPNCVWLNGRMTLVNMAIAKFLKKRVPNVWIFWALPGSEYYATNKIEEYLLFNEPLFSVIDGIVLDDFENTRGKIVQVLEQGRELDEVNNLMYAKRDAVGNIKIYRSPYKKYMDHAPVAIEVTSRAKHTEYMFKIAPWEVVNVKLYPQKICSWNKCTFCGINKKYKVMGEEGTLEEKIKELSILQREGCKYFWFIDEEISAEQMRLFSQALIDNELQIKWQIRARISKDFADIELCKSLSDAGLKEIRFGLESASYRILRLMNKFDDSFSLELVEQIVTTFQKVGVSVHFPVIIGFPGETDVEREQTYQFLRYLKSEYDNVSFNVNILGLDVSSQLFKNWQHYGIASIHFPCNPHYFLGNLVEWDCAETPFWEDKLKAERDDFMREQMYPWMPEGALIYPHIFYRLMETIRNTLTIKDRIDERKKVIERGSLVRWNSSAIICSNIIYNIKRHQKIISNINMMAVKKIFDEPIVVEEAIVRLSDFLIGYTTEDAQELVFQLYYFDFLVNV